MTFVFAIDIGIKTLLLAFGSWKKIITLPKFEPTTVKCIVSQGCITHSLGNIIKVPLSLSLCLER